MSDRATESVLINVATLADFKRFLARPGATVQTIRHDGYDGIARLMKRLPEEESVRRAVFFGPRRIMKVQTKAVQFEGGSWLYFESAKQYRFEGDTVTVDLHTHETDAPFKDVMVYRLSVAA